MKYVVISDIHSNYPALRTFQELYDPSMRIICLGDTIGYGADPDLCTDFIREHSYKTINGNHERMLFNPDLRHFANPLAVKAIQWTSHHLSDRNRIFLQDLLNSQLLEEKVLLVHGSPNNPDEYIGSSKVAMVAHKTLENAGIDICFFGHTHIAGIYDQNGDYFHDTNGSYQLIEGNRYLINPGSIGQPRDRNPSASYCIFDSDERIVEFYRYNYPIEESVDRIIDADLPENLGMRLFYGI